MNNDTTLAPKCILNLVKELDTLRSRNKHVAGVQPKILFHEFPTIIDAIGTGINRDGTGFNIGVGQVDLGQFDKTMRIFGLCFAAAFIDRKVLSAVGVLPENYFVYEDIDWCYRANSQGYEFHSAPQAVVYTGTPPPPEESWSMMRNDISSSVTDSGRFSVTSVEGT